jgi:hypothetical protein
MRFWATNWAFLAFAICLLPAHADILQLTKEQIAKYNFEAVVYSKLMSKFDLRTVMRAVR